jgi:hypothetical protein
MTDTRDAPLPGVIRQIGYIVRDIDQAIATWLTLGVGPWYVLRGQQQDGLYRGEPCTVTLSIAFANSGELQIELIQSEDDTPSIYREFLDSGREGFHQFAWWAEDFDAAMKSIEASGRPVVWSGGVADATRFAYVESPVGPTTILEIMELTEVTSGMAEFVRAAATDWDGTDPIRPIATS